MSNMEEITVTPKYKNGLVNGGFKHIHHDVHPEDSDDESDHEDEGGRALLGGSHERKHEREGMDGDKISIWGQVRRLVIEVRGICRWSDAFADTGH